MTDRELLEMAAKAGGVDRRRLNHAWPERFDDDLWDPLTDDGDALRLAVKLGADILQSKGSGVAVWILESRVSSGVVEYGDDPYAATRRAIVRAAAEIGRGME